MPILNPQRLKQLASTPLLSSSWYYVAAATFSVCNKPDEIPLIFKYMLEQPQIAGKKEKEFQVAQEMREALLKGAALAGLPKAINSLTELKNVTPDHLRQTEPQRDLHLPTQEDIARGYSFWDHVYGKISTRVKHQLYTAYPDLSQYALNHVYSPLLSFTKVLGPKETSLVVVACLVPQDVNPQLKGHLKGALNNGATKEEMDSLREMSMTICQWSGVTWRNEVAKL